MQCPKCAVEMVRATATQFGEEYDYCRPCGKELAEIIKSLLADTQRQFDESLKSCKKRYVVPIIDQAKEPDPFARFRKKLIKEELSLCKRYYDMVYRDTAILGEWVGRITKV